MEIKKLIEERNKTLNVDYIDETHTYYSNDQELTSVTKFTHKFFPFNAELVAKKLESYSKTGKTAQDYLTEWKQSAEFGTHIHKLIEDFLIGKTLTEEEKFEIKHALDFIQQHNFKHIASEIKVYSPSLGLAGTIDWLAEDDKGKLWIIDFKTTKNITNKNPSEKSTFPINHLDHCKINAYSFQTGIYAFILNNEYKLNKKIEQLGILQLNLNKTYKFYTIENGQLPNLQNEIIQTLFNHEELIEDFLNK